MVIGGLTRGHLSFASGGTGHRERGGVGRMRDSLCAPYVHYSRGAISLSVEIQ